MTQRKSRFAGRSDFESTGWKAESTRCHGLLGLCLALACLVSACQPATSTPVYMPGQASGPLPAGGPVVIVPRDSKEQFYQALDRALSPHGFHCKVEDNVLVCRHDSVLNVTFSYKPDTSRLVHFATFGLKDATHCSPDLFERLNRGNWEYNVAQMACKNEAVSFQNTLLVPVSGFTDAELFAYLRWWSRAVLDMIKEANLVQDMK
jgi:hypothetical protein